jgi:Asp/Glu/hydantoin racemase
VTTIGFLHTADVHVATFGALLAELAPGWGELHEVDERLLADARAGIDVSDRLAARLGALAAAGADVIVCTCSTLGELAEQVALPLRPSGRGLRPGAVPVLRVDRPMAQAAVARAAAGQAAQAGGGQAASDQAGAGRGGRIAVVAAVAATLPPTVALLRACAGGAEVEIVAAPCLDAWSLFEAGDQRGYLDRIAAHVRTLDADVIVLAQASMAAAGDLLGDLGVPVLSSPRTAVERAVAVAGGAAG